MSVKELIELLSHCDPEMRVLVRGHEDGFNDAGKPYLVHVAAKPEDHYWEGRYLDVEDCRFGDEYPKPANTFAGMVIP